MFLFDGGGVGAPHRHRTSDALRHVTLTAVMAIVALQSAAVAAQGTYSVMAPSVLRPNRDYNAVVSSHGTKGPLRMGVEITGNIDAASDVSSVFQTRQEAVLQPDSSQMLNFQIGDLSAGDYHLSVSAVGDGVEFRNITALKFEPKSYSVFIETDRAIYRPGDVVQFRVIVVNPNLRPSVTGAIDVHVEDGSGVAVKQWSRVFTNKGVWSSQLKLSSEPVMGDWSIVVTVLGQENRGGFFVAEFVEPKFEVIVELPEYLSLDDDVMPVKVHANYPYGRPIKGEVTVQVTPRYKYDYLQAPYDPPVSFVRGIMGEVDIEMNLKNDLGLQGDYARELEVTAYVREDLTGRIQNSTSVVTVYRFPYKMNFIRSSDTFKPGLKYTAYLKLSYQDGRPISSGEVYIRHAFLRDERAFVETRHSIPSNGIVTIEVFPPLLRPGPTWTLAFEARYLNLTQWLGEVQRARSPGGAFLQATLLSPNPTVGEEVIVGLNSTESLIYFVYEILARGDVLHARTLQARQGTSHTFRFIASSSMYPRSRLLIYTVRPDGEVVADSLHFTVQRRERDRVSLTVTPRWVDVSSDGKASISISAKPNSLIGVSAVDTKSLKLMKQEYKLNNNDIIAELETYDSGRSFFSESADSSDDRNLRRARRSVETVYNWYGTSTAHDVFENAGVVVMTNAHVFSQPDLAAGAFLPGHGPIDGRGWDPENRPPAHNGPFGRLPPVGSPGVSVLRPDLGPGVAYKPPPRPPLAGPYAFSFLPPPPDAKPRIYLSQAIPSTWMFTHRQTGLNGIITWQESVPRLPSKYNVAGFAIDDFDGLILADTTTEVVAYRPFYISARVPDAVVRGEAVAVELVVFNEVNRNLSVTVTIHNDKGEFLFPDFSNEIDQGSPATQMTRDVVIQGGDRSALSFMVVPQKLGEVEVKLTATGAPYFDTNIQVLNVKPEGHRLHVNKAVFIDTATSPDYSSTLNITLPRNVVNNSLKIEISAIGDILGNAVTSLEDLVRLPKGCGEQNMASTIPIIILMDYLKANGELGRVLEEKASAELEQRFQQQLTYRQKDGSFSFFDEYRGGHGSTWLTAFVVKSLRSASNYIDVPRHVITDALAWLVRQQQGDGSFSEPETTEDSAVFLNDTRTSPLALTSFVLLAILEVEDYSSPAVRNAGNRAIEYISSALTQQGPVEDVYGLTVASYALHLAGHAHRDTAFYMLEAKAKVEGDQKWWPTGDVSPSTEEGNIVSSAAVEQTAYALLSYVQRSLAMDALGPVLKWLTQRRNDMGGFTSTQDTAVGLAALSGAAGLHKRLSAGAGAGGVLTVRLVYGERGHRFNIMKSNAQALQTLELPEDTRTVELSVSGDGLAIVQLSYSYNVQVTAPRPAFSLDPQLDRTTDANRLRLTACTGFLVRDNITLSSNMAVMEVELPSGYVIDNDALPGLYDYPHVKRVERLQRDQAQGLAIYFDTLTAKEVCPTVVAYRVNRVAFQKPAAVLVYDYYDLTRQARQFYNAAPATLCDICDIGECEPKTCDVQIAELNRQRQTPDDFDYPATVIETSRASAIHEQLTASSLAAMVIWGLWVMR